MRNIQYLTIDLNKKTQQDVTANEGEIGSRFLKIKITDNNVPVDLTGTKVYLYALKSDNTKLFNLVEIENATQGIVLAELTSQLLISAGVVKLTLVITEGSNKLISKEFTLKVDGSIFDDDAIESSNEFTALTTALGTVQGIENKFAQVNEQFITITNKSNVEWRNFDNGYITIIFDDFQDDLVNVFSVFKAKNIPLSCAIPTIKVELGVGNINLLKEIENSGGEILSHGYTSNPITSSSSIDFIKTEFEKSKFLLEKNGLRVNGYVRAGGTGSIAFTDILNLFYKNYIYGFSMGEDNLLFGRESLIMTLDDFKNKVNTAIANKQWIRLYAHGFNEVSSELLSQMLDYINLSGIIPVTYSEMYSKFVTGNSTTELSVQKSDNLLAINYIKEIDDRTTYYESPNLLKNSAMNGFINDTKWIKDKTNYPSSNFWWTEYNRGFYTAIRYNLGDKTALGKFKIYQDMGLSRLNIGEILHAGLSLQQQTSTDSKTTLRIYKQFAGESALELVSEKIFTGKISNKYIYTEWTSTSSLDVTNIRYEIEFEHPTETSDTMVYFYLPKLVIKTNDKRYSSITS